MFISTSDKVVQAIRLKTNLSQDVLNMDKVYTSVRALMVMRHVGLTLFVHYANITRTTCFKYNSGIKL